MAECSLNELKTLCAEEKLLVTSNFSFSHSVFNSLVLQTCENQGLFGKRLTLPNDKILDWTKLKALADDKINMIEKMKTLWEKEKMLVTSIYFILYNVLKKLLFLGH